MTDQQQLIGRRLGNYEIQALIGSGGMANVYRGFDHNLRRAVAIKILLPYAAAEPGLAERFRQEALLIARLNHPNIVNVYDLGEQDGLTYMVEELLPGPTLGKQLHDITARGEHFSREQILAAMRQLAAGLDAAHAAGIIHRDVKPDNAIWNGQGRLVLTDFGIARQMLGNSGHTRTGMIIGTPDYLSPEQAQGLSLTPASDVYALGIVLYELISGTVPFEGPTPMSVALEHIQAPPPPLAPLRPDLPPAVEAVVQQALAKDPAARFSSPGALAKALEQAWPAPQPVLVRPATDIHEQATQVWQSPSPLPSVPRPSPPVQPAPSPPRPAPAPVATAPSVSRRSLLPLLGGLVLLLLLGGAAMAMRGSFGAATDPTATGETAAVVESTGTPTVEPTTAPSAAPTEVPTDLPPALPPALTKPIAFASERGGSWDIWVVQGDGSTPRNLTNGKGANYGPAWSPDGQQIAFHSNRSGNDEIYVMNSDGSGVRNLSNNPANDREPAWSPDGRQIAFYSNPNGNWDLYLMNADGSNRRRLTSDFSDEFAPAWSPDGRKIAFTSNADKHDQINVINTDGSGRRNLSQTAANDKLPAWSPDGTLIAFASDRDGNGEIYVMNADGKKQRNLTNNPAWDTMPGWSPDGQFITFTTNRDANDEIYRMNADGSDPHDLSNDGVGDWDPVWSP